MSLVDRISSTVAALILAAAGARADTGEYRNLGYIYLSPLPGAEYTATQTKFVLVRFKDVAPSALTNFRTLDLDGQRKMYGIRPDAPIARVSERWRGPANRICL
jgi:hypothetical protein